MIDILESNLIILSPDKKTLYFSNSLEEIFDTCQDYFQDPKFRDENSEVDFKNSVKENYLIKSTNFYPFS